MIVKCIKCDSSDTIEVQHCDNSSIFLCNSCGKRFGKLNEAYQEHMRKMDELWKKKKKLQ